MVWLHILKNCAAIEETECNVTNPKSHAILLTFLVKHFSKHYCYIKCSDLSMHTYTHTLCIFKSLYCGMPEKENTLNCIPEVSLASEQSNKGSEVRNVMLALHFKQLQKRKNSTKDQKFFSVLTGSQEAERTGEVRVKPVSP